MSNPSVNIGFGIVGAVVLVFGGALAYNAWGPTSTQITNTTSPRMGGQRRSRRNHRHSGRKTRKH
jgi:hypothetical protein